MTLPGTIGWFVHTWWKRDGIRDATLRSLNESDAKHEYVVERQSETEDPVDFYVSVLTRYSETYDWFVRFEDDTLVNRHIFYNVRTWDVPVAEPNFGLGYLSFSESVLNDLAHVRYGCVTKCPYRWYRELHGGGGILFNSAKLKQVLPSLKLAMQKYVDCFPELGIPYSCVLSGLFFDLGLVSYLHVPGIVYMDLRIPRSTDGKVLPESTFGNQMFDMHWRR